MTVSKKLWFGILLPLLILSAYLLVVALWPRSDVGIEDSRLYVVLALPVLIPGAALFNSWVFFIQWRRKSTLLLGGMSLPAFVGLAAYLFCYGPYVAQDAIARAVFYPPSWVWIVVSVLPLLIGIIYRILVRKKASQ